MNKAQKVISYLSDRVLEQSSFTAYITVMITAYSTTLPVFAKVLMYAAATYKWLIPEGETLFNVGKPTLRKD